MSTGEESSRLTNAMSSGEAFPSTSRSFFFSPSSICPSHFAACNIARSIRPAAASCCGVGATLGSPSFWKDGFGTSAEEPPASALLVVPGWVTASPRLLISASRPPPEAGAVAPGVDPALAAEASCSSRPPSPPPAWPLPPRTEVSRSPIPGWAPAALARAASGPGRLLLLTELPLPPPL